jgi:hypothetical protein
MDPLIAHIGTDSGDYSTITSWEADRRYDSDTINVGVVHDDSFQYDDYSQFLRVEADPKGPHFVLLSSTGVVLASRIAGRLHKVHETFPPDQQSPYSTVEGMDREEVVGHGDDENIEEIARDYIRQRLDEYSPGFSRSQAELIIRTGSQRLVRLIAENPDEVDNLEWRDLERVLEEAFTGIGFVTELTPASKDGGKDIILRLRRVSDSVMYYVEVKHWRSHKKVGATVLKDFVSIVVRDGAMRGLLLTTSGVAGGSLEKLTEVERRAIRVGDKTKIVSLCQSYVRSESGIIIPSTSLPAQFVVGTL